MEFSQEFLSNPIFRSEWLRYDPPPSRRHPGVIPEAATLMTNGDYVFRFNAPNAKEITVTPEYGERLPNGKIPFRGIPRKAEKGPDGVFQYILPYDEWRTGHRHIDIDVDGTRVVWPYLPVCWAGSHLRNYVEIPDYDQYFAYVQDVPHGSVNQEVYWSDATQRFERCVVYTPPGYMNGTEEYPVLYLLHGGGENETVWCTSFRANNIMDNLIASGECVPFIIVMNAGMIRYPDTPTDTDWRDLCLEKEIIDSCIPYIESHYRVKKDKFMRAVMGESMGCHQACDMAFRNPDVFGNFGALSSAFYHDDIHTLYERPWKKTLADKEKFQRDWKVIFFSFTQQEDHSDFVLKDKEILREAGLLDGPNVYFQDAYPERYTRNASWRMGLRDYAKLLFHE